MTTNPTAYTLTIDDDAIIPVLVEAATGVPTRSFTSGAAFREELSSLEPMAIILDVNLGIDDCGLDLIPELRSRWAFTPIIVVTGDTTSDIVGQALAAGANDFVRKPLDTSELAARVKARMVELKGRAETEGVVMRDLTFERQHRTLRSKRGVRHLSPTEALLLDHLFKAQGMMIKRDDLKRAVWGGVKVSDNAVNKKLHEVRAALRALTDEVGIETTYGVGVALKVGPNAGNSE